MSRFREAEIAVVGAGIVGLSVTQKLRSLGVSVRCFDAGVAAGAQSAGGSRIFRAAYADPQMLALATEAGKGWAEWEAQAGKRLVERTGSILVTEKPEAEFERLSHLGVRVRWLDATGQRELLPIHNSWNRPVILEEDAGTIRAGDITEWLKEQAGKSLVEHTPVLGLTQRHLHVLVTTRTEIWKVRRVLVCAGMHTPLLAKPLGVDVPQVYSVHQRLLFPIKPEFRNVPMVSFRDKSDHRYGVLYTYGLPALHDDLFAVGLEPSDTDRTGGGHPDEVVEHTLALVEQTMPGLDTETIHIESCVSTALEHVDSGAPWESERLEVARKHDIDFFAGGHLFKFAPVLGDRLAGVALRGDVPTFFQADAPVAAFSRS